QRVRRVRRDVVHHAGVPAAHEAPHHVGAHAPEPDHSKLHSTVLLGARYSATGRGRGDDVTMWSAGEPKGERRQDHQRPARQRGLGPLREEAGDGGAAAAAPRPGATGLAHFVDRTCPLPNGLADGSITDSVAMADEQATSLNEPQGY